MKVSLNLIAQFTDIQLEESELLKRIASRIGEIESVERLGPKYDGIVVGVISEAGTHPDADKLGVYKVAIGPDKTVQVVAGDKTLKQDDRVAYIPPGKTVPATFSSEEPLVITKRDLRGQESNGMLASAQELDFGSDHSGVLVLADYADTAAGTPLAPLLELEDTVVEIENKALTHRPDCFGHIGFAREVAGIQGAAFQSPEWFLAEEVTFEPTDEALALSAVNEAPETCRRLSVSGYSSVTVGQSPLKLRSYLQRLGVRPLNSVVDVTNYLMLLTGQPLHAFDYDKLAERSDGDVVIHVRHAREGETLQLLGGKTVSLTPEDMVIATDKVPVALAGVMGGAETEVSEATKRIVVEVANFDMYAIRNTSMRHGLFTEAVTRFARGQDPNRCAAVQAQAAKLLHEHCGARHASLLIDVFEKPRQPNGIVANAQRVQQVLGTDHLSPAEMQQTLSNIEIDTVLNKDNLDITTPTWRADLRIPEDIIEEIGRLNGYDTLPVSVPRRPLTPANFSHNEHLKRDLGQYLRAAGGHEVLSYSGVSSKLIDRATQDPAHAFTIKNALSPELEHMRLSLTPSLLEKIYGNVRQGHEQFALFEIGTVHHKELMADNLPEEQPAVAFVIAGSKKSALGAKPGAAYYHGGYWLDELLAHLGFAASEKTTLTDDDPRLKNDPWLQQASRPFEPRRRAAITVKEGVIGVIGEYRPSVKAAFKLPQCTAGFELHRDRLLKAQKASTAARYRPLSRFPKVENDITLMTPADRSFAAVESELTNGLLQSQLRFELRPMDIYKKSGDETRNLTFRVWSWRDDRTLTSEEVNAALDQAVQYVNEKCGTRRV